MAQRVYDRIGVGYAVERRADPRIAAHVVDALADAPRVVNVGAGAGSYEPVSTRVAVEPSPVMIAQRPPGSAPVVQAVAEALPLPDACADAGLALLTVHHWTDPARGIAELVRVAPSRTVVLCWDAAVTYDLWLVRDYLPEIVAIEAHMPKAAEITAMLEACGRVVERRLVPVPWDCTDAFGAAQWRRPERYLHPAVQASASFLALLDPGVRDRGLGLLADDLASGRWHERNADLLDRVELDVGYRLLVATPA